MIKKVLERLNSLSEDMIRGNKELLYCQAILSFTFKEIFFLIYQNIEDIKDIVKDFIEVDNKINYKHEFLEFFQTVLDLFLELNIFKKENDFIKLTNLGRLLYSEELLENFILSEIYHTKEFQDIRVIINKLNLNKLETKLSTLDLRSEISQNIKCSDSIPLILHFLELIELNLESNLQDFTIKKKVIFLKENIIEEKTIDERIIFPKEYLQRITEKIEQEEDITKNKIDFIKAIQRNSKHLCKAQEELKKFKKEEEEIIRNKALRNGLYDLYKVCQICKLSKSPIKQIITKNKNPYLEVHHIIPLACFKDPLKWSTFIAKSLIEKLNIPQEYLDVKENMIVVCPHHHKWIHKSYPYFKFHYDKTTGDYYFSSDSTDKKNKFWIFFIKNHYEFKDYETVF